MVQHCSHAPFAETWLPTTCIMEASLAFLAEHFFAAPSTRLTCTSVKNKAVATSTSLRDGIANFVATKNVYIRVWDPLGFSTRKKNENAFRGKRPTLQWGWKTQMSKAMLACRQNKKIITTGSFTQVKYIPVDSALSRALSKTGKALKVFLLSQLENQQYNVLKET